MNNKRTSLNVASFASSILRNPNSSDIQKSLAASALSQRDADKQTGSKMEDKAAVVLASDKYNSDTKVLAAAVLSQSVPSR